MLRLMKENSANIEARMNLIRPMTANIENPKSRNAIKIKSVGNTQKRTRQTHRQTVLICPTKATIDARYAKTRRAIGKIILSNYARS